MTSFGISPLRDPLADAFAAITSVIDKIGADMDLEAARRPVSQVFDRSALNSQIVAPSEPLPPHCGTCASFHESTSECRRFAPYLRGPDDHPKTKWPDVSPADYCGEHASR